jgi:hypothetical protein
MPETWGLTQGLGTDRLAFDTWAILLESKVPSMTEIHFIPDDLTPTHRRGPRITTLMMMIGVLVVGGLAGSFLRALSKAREAGRASQCLCIKQIALAFHNYHSVYGCFPPAYVADSNGKPMHSWRVLILPFLEQNFLYNSYNMAEPWDSPDNRKLLDQRPNVYHCPSRDCGPSLTSYVAIVGPMTAFPGAGSIKLDDVLDGTSRTIMIAEVANVDIPWTEPRDLDTRTMSWLIDDPSKPGLSSPHSVGPSVIYVDGMVQHLGRSFPSAALKGMTTINGGEPDVLDHKRH